MQNNLITSWQGVHVHFRKLSQFFASSQPDGRIPAASAKRMLEAENTILRSNKEDLRSHVICPGILYGDGECNSGFHGLWKQAWEASVLDVFGSGKIDKGSFCAIHPNICVRS